MSDMLTIKNAKIIFRNFSGKEKGKFNPEGCRNFCVVLSNEDAEKLLEDGWNVKYLKPLEDGDEPQAFLQVSVAFGNYPPSITMVCGDNKILIKEETVGILDRADIELANVRIRPYHWSVGGKSGIKAYLSKLKVQIWEDDDFDFEEE